MAKLVTKRKTLLVSGAALLVHLLLLLNTKFTAWPEMTLWPYLMLKGWLPYRDIAIAHTPALFVDLVLFYKIFGVGIWQLKAYTYLLIVVTDVALYWVVREIWNRKAAVYSLIFYIPFQIYYEGNGLWFDLPLALFALLLFYFSTKKEYFMTGLLWALAFFIKQTAFWFLIPIFFMIIIVEKTKKIQKMVDFIKGVIIVFAIVIGALFLLGILSDFWFWGVKFGIGILPMATGQIQLPAFRRFIVAALPFLVFLILPLLCKKKHILYLIPWGIVSAFGALPRFELFHFQPAVPFIAMAAGVALASIKKNTQTRVMFSAYVLISFTIVVLSISKNAGNSVRFWEPEIKRITEYVIDNSRKEDYIYTLNTWDNIYALSGTLPSARPWVPHLKWYMELPGIQDEIVSGLIENEPKMIVLREFDSEGLSSYKPEKVLEFIYLNYKQDDVVANHIILTPKP